MPTSRLVPQGVRYDLDEADHPPRWPWVLGGLLLVAVVTGLLLTLHPRLGRIFPQKRSLSSPAQVVPATEGTAPIQNPLPFKGITNSMPRWPASVDPELRHLMDGAEAVFRADDLPSARRRYLEILDRPNLGLAAAFVEQRLGEIGMQLILTPRPMPEKIEHIVKTGESADKIAKLYNVTRELLMKGNDIRRPDRLQPGQHLLVLNKPVFSIEVNRSINALRLFLNNKLLKRYAISTGRRNETPKGSYVIRNRQERPTWWRADGRMIPYGHRENILGTRWVSLQATGTTAVVKGYGICGGWNEADMGNATTAGCIRMRNADIEELCLIVPEGTPVRVAE